MKKRIMNTLFAAGMISTEIFPNNRKDLAAISRRPSRRTLATTTTRTRRLLLYAFGSIEKRNGKFTSVTLNEKF